MSIFVYQKYIMDFQQTIEQTSQKKIAQTLIMVQQYKLKTNFIGCNMNKKQLEFYYNFYRGKTRDRLSKILKKFAQIQQQLNRNILFCQFAELKALNNCIRDYRRRVNQLTFQPTKYSYAAFQKQERQLQQILIKNHFEQSIVEQVIKIQEKVVQGKLVAQQNYESKKDIYDEKHRTPFTKITKVIDSTQAQCSRLYDNFQRSMMTISSQVANNMDKFSIYVSKWQHLASVRAYEVKSKKQEQIQAQLNAKNNRFNKTEQQLIAELTLALTKCTPYAPVRQQYQRRIQQLQKTQIQKKMRKNMAGNLINRKRNKRGILRQTPKQIQIVDWHQTFDKEKKHIYPIQSLWNLQKKIDDRSENLFAQDFDYQKIAQQQQKNQLKTNKTSKQQLLNLYVPANLSSKCWNDTTRTISFLMKNAYNMSDFTFQKNQVFQLCDTPLQILQARIQFEETVQSQLQEHDDRHKKQTIQKEREYEREEQRANNYHFNIGYKFLKQSQETAYFSKRQYCSEFLPNKEFNAQENKTKKQIIKQISQNQDIQINKEIKDQQTLPIKAIQIQQNFRGLPNDNNGEFDIGQWIQFSHPKEQTKQTKVIKQNNDQLKKVSRQEQFYEPRTQLERFATCYFKMLQLKTQRSFISNPLKIPVKFVYFYSYLSIKNQVLSAYKQSLRLFVVCQDLLFLLQKFNAHQQISLMKVITIQVGQNKVQSSTIQKHIKSLLKGNLMTFTHLIFEKVQEGNFLAFKIGLLRQFSKNKDEALQMQDSEVLDSGQQILEDYKYFQDQDQQVQQGQQGQEQKGNGKGQ